VKGKKYMHIWFVSIYDSLDRGDTCSVLVTRDAAYKALCCHNIIQPDNRVWGPHHQVVSSRVEWHATDLVCILPHKSSTWIGCTSIDNNGTMCWWQDPRMRNHHQILLWTNQSMTISSLRYILILSSYYHPTFPWLMWSSMMWCDVIWYTANEILDKSTDSMYRVDGQSFSEMTLSIYQLTRHHIS